MSSSFGHLFRITTFGESHGGGVGVIIDGCPSRLALGPEDIQLQLDRRRPGQGALTTPRNEADRVEILAGVEDGLTLGSPVAMLVRNRDQKPGDYRDMQDIPRPSHADFTYREKFGIKSASGGGRASARETIGRVAGGAVAEKWLRDKYGVEIVAFVDSVAGIQAPTPDLGSLTRALVDQNEVRCPDPDLAQAMAAAILAARGDRDSVGGTITCVCRQVPAGWGEPVFDKCEALLARAMLSIPAAKGFESGSGFAGASLRGSQNNDPFRSENGVLTTASNNSGGIQGGITNGQPLVFRVAFKPPATIGTPQQTVDFSGQDVTLEGKGRHDPCVLPRAVPIVESMAALVLADLALRQQSRR
jgi:chorismate synthase|nr:chorismate synthase [Candidatus Krumholzibacteria bacterium]